MREPIHRDWPRAFRATSWTMVLRAGRGSSKDLERLYCTYWYPVYAFMRRKGRPSEDARDLTQQLFEELIARNDLASLAPGHGRFRSWLLRCAEHLLSNDYRKTHAIKRGRGQRPLSLDGLDPEERYKAEPSDGVTPESLYDYRWAMTVLELALDRLRAQQRTPQDQLFFDGVRSLLLRLDRERPDFEAVAERFGLSVGAVKVRVHRLQHRDLPSHVRAVIAETFDRSCRRQDDIASELRHLIRSIDALRRPAP